MACRSGDSEDYAADANAATRAACEVVKALRRRAPAEWAMMLPTLSKATRAWIEEHKELDREREEEERAERKRKRLVREATAKLTPEEREALGL